MMVLEDSDEIRICRMKGALFFFVFEGRCPSFFFFGAPFKKKGLFFFAPFFRPSFFFFSEPFFFWRAVNSKKMSFFLYFCVFVGLFFFAPFFFLRPSAALFFFFESALFFLKGVFFRRPFFALRFFLFRPSFYIAYPVVRSSTSIPSQPHVLIFYNPPHPLPPYLKKIPKLFIRYGFRRQCCTFFPR